MSQYIDASVYPDCEPPLELNTPELQADYLLWIIGAFDQGLPPGERTLELFAGWRDVFDSLQLLHSPAYHALRSYFARPPLPRKKPFVEPTYRILDALEGREDGFKDRI